MRKRYDELTDEDLARICHEAHVALRIGLNDSADDVHWDALPRRRKDTVVNQVRLFREGKTLAEVHEAWVIRMAEDGWRHGLTRNLIQKMHPNMIPYEQLPPEEQAKVRQAQRIVFTHVMPETLERIAYQDIRSRPVEICPGAFMEPLPDVCVTHNQFAPCVHADENTETDFCVISDRPEDVDAVYRKRYER